jgi:hypothetical protein
MMLVKLPTPTDGGGPCCCPGIVRFLSRRCEGVAANW